ncbi:hypothetical protein E2C01_030931 [Portunus trituberculatus]|uniref:Uncharacterized protein n=1 Tax=Portunus trituberculatus TaxID=210409 RepID=A0A5B7ET60_PORTR|nr:hypothetical protein [Portunus trituberculatus]
MGVCPLGIVEVVISLIFEVATPVSHLLCHNAETATRIERNTSRNGTGAGDGARLAASLARRSACSFGEHLRDQGPTRTQHDILFWDPQPYCDDCLVPLTVRHLLVECPSLTDLIHRYLYRCRSRDSSIYCISKVLGPECLEQGHDVFRFLGEAGLLPKL